MGVGCPQAGGKAASAARPVRSRLMEAGEGEGQGHRALRGHRGDTEGTPKRPRPGSACPEAAALGGPGAGQAAGPNRHTGTSPRLKGGSAGARYRRGFAYPGPKPRDGPSAGAARPTPAASPSEGPGQGHTRLPPPAETRPSRPPRSLPASYPRSPLPCSPPQPRSPHRCPRSPPGPAAAPHQGSRAYSSILSGATALARLPAARLAPRPGAGQWVAEGGTKARAEVAAHALCPLRPAPPRAD